MKLTDRHAEAPPASINGYIIAQSHNKSSHFSKRQQWGIGVIGFLLIIACVGMYLASNAPSVFILLFIYLLLLGIAFRRILKVKPRFRAIYENGYLIIDFDIMGQNEHLERQRIIVPARNIIGYHTHSFLGSRSSHVSIQFKTEGHVVTTRPIITEALSNEELQKLLNYLEAQITNTGKLPG